MMIGKVKLNNTVLSSLVYYIDLLTKYDDPIIRQGKLVGLLNSIDQLYRINSDSPKTLRKHSKLINTQLSVIYCKLKMYIEDDVSFDISEELGLINEVIIGYLNNISTNGLRIDLVTDLLREIEHLPKNTKDEVALINKLDYYYQKLRLHYIFERDVDPCNICNVNSCLDDLIDKLRKYSVYRDSLRMSFVKITLNRLDVLVKDVHRVG